MIACRLAGLSLRALFIVSILAMPAVAQPGVAQPNSAEASLTFNQIDSASYPIQADILGPATVTVEITGNAALAPLLLSGSPDVVVPGLWLSPTITVNIDVWNFFEVFNGLNGPAGTLASFAQLNSAGYFSWSFPVPHPGSAPQVVGGFQAAIADVTQPDGLAVSGATRLVVIPTPNIGNFDFSGGPATDRHVARIVSVPNQTPVVIPGTASVNDDFDVNPLRLAGFQAFSDEVTSPYWGKDLATLNVTAVNVVENTAFPYIKTLYGDLYLIEENVPIPPLPGSTPSNPIHCWSYALSNPGTGPQLLLSSSIAGNGPAGDGNPFKEKVQIQNNRMAYVQDPTGASDKVLISALDGTLPGAPGGIGTFDATPVFPEPVPAGISDDSLTITTNNLYFVGNLTDPQPTEGQLYSAPIDGSSTATVISLPILGTGSQAGVVDAKMRYSEDRGFFIFQAGASPGEEDLYMVMDTGAAPGGTLGGTSVCNLTQFPAATTISSFGTASSGTGNTIAISTGPVPPATGNPWIAFVTDENGSDELWLQEAACPSAPALHLTGATNFDPAIDTIVEMHWASNDLLLFFAGDTPSTTDLFAYDRSSSTFRNLTAPPSSPPPSPPFAPGGTFDPGGNFFNGNGTWFFIFNQGTTGGQSVTNLLALNVATNLANLALVDVTGGQFSGGSLPNATGATPGNSHMQFAATNDTVAFIAQAGPGNEDNVFAFDCAAPLAPRLLTSNLGSTSIRIDNLVISPDGTLVAFSENTTGSEIIYVANLSLGNSATMVFEVDPAVIAAGGRVTDGTIQWISDHELMISYGSGDEKNPDDALLYFVEVAVRFDVKMTEEEKTNWHY